MSNYCNRQMAWASHNMYISITDKDIDLYHESGDSEYPTYDDI